MFDSEHTCSQCWQMFPEPLKGGLQGCDENGKTTMTLRMCGDCVESFLESIESMMPCRRQPPPEPPKHS